LGHRAARKLRPLSKVAVTGASGKAGRAVVRTLLERDHDVLAVDVVPAAGSATPSLLADLTDFGETVECLAGVESVVHLAAIPASGIRSDETTFRTNILSRLYPELRKMGGSPMMRGQAGWIGHPAR
jgi:nucleoside-diphosphate-sugar epimerase